MLAASEPTIFIHGTWDGFGSIDEVAAALKLIPARTELLPHRCRAGTGVEAEPRRDLEKE